MIYFLYGPNTFLLKQHLRQLINRVGGQLLRFDVSQKPEPDQEILEAAKNSSLFDDFRTVLLENILERELPWLDKKLKTLAGLTLFLVQEGAIKRGQQALLGKTRNLADETFEFEELGPVALRRWLAKELARYGLQADLAAVELLANSSPGDLWQLYSAIKKLASATSTTVLTKADVLEHIKLARPSDIFKTVEYLASRNKKRVLMELQRHLEQGDPPLRLFSMFQWQWRVLLLLKHAQSNRTALTRLSKDLKLHSFVIQKNSALLDYFTAAELANGHRRLFELDWQVKLGKIKPELALDLFVASLG